jgi:hypothetical protein
MLLLHVPQGFKSFSDLWRRAGARMGVIVGHSLLLRQQGRAEAVQDLAG